MSSVTPVGFNTELSKAFFNEQEALNLLKDHVNKSMIHGSKPLENIKITKIQSTYAYLYTLETFYDERSIRVVEDYLKGAIGPRPKTLEVAVYAKTLFVDETVKDILIPNSAKEIICQECGRKGRIECGKCNLKGFVKCKKCSGIGKIEQVEKELKTTKPCNVCMESGEVKCSCDNGWNKCVKCKGRGIKRYIELVNVHFYSNKSSFYKKSNEDLPNDFLKKCSGERVFSEQQTPYVNPLRYFKEHEINQASANIHRNHLANKLYRSPKEQFFIDEEMSQILAQKHEVYQIPVTKCDYLYENKERSFYIVGVEQSVFIRNYPVSCCCIIS